MAFCMSFSGLFFAFFKGYLYSACLLAYFPVMLIAVGSIGVVFSRGFSQNMKAYGQSAGYAEQALNAIKVVFAFGQEETEAANYEKYLNRARSAGIRTHVFGALTIGFFLFSTQAYYAYSFFVGSFLIT